MRNAISAVPVAALLAALFAVSSLAGITPAAASPAQDKVISDFCDGHPEADECNDWRYNRARWSNEQYQSFYQAHRSEKEFSTAAAAGAFGPSADGQLMNSQSVEIRPVVGSQSGDAADANWPVGTHRGNVVGNQPEVIGDSPTHVADCQATFKSYDVSTDSYMGFNGFRQKCKL